MPRRKYLFTARQDFNLQRKFRCHSLSLCNSHFGLLMDTRWRRGSQPNALCLRAFQRHPGWINPINLDAEFVAPAWMKVQVQVNGSYRSSDMVEALRWMLPDAEGLEDSIIVLLDWYSGHRTDEVEEVIAAKGHILLFHGGGTPPFG